MSDVLFLSRRNVAALLDLDDCIAAVENAFAMLGRGELPPPAIAGVHATGGAFHIKAAIAGGRFAAKVNANFFEATPRIKGVVMLADASDGTPLAIMDSIEITILRTGAATAVAAKFLARADARTALICGCGLQGRIQAKALARVRPIECVFAFDTDRTRAAQLGEVVDEIVPADIVVTCTPSRAPFLERVAPGTFVASVGADSEEKSEIAPSLLASAKVVTDVTEQCATIGDLRVAIAAGAMTRDGVHGELGEIVAGRKPGRERADEVIVFDSTGMALQDVAAASIVYDRAVERGGGVRMPL